MPNLGYFAVKEAVLPFSKFDNVDPLLGPEMKSTGEVMGLGSSFAEAYAKAQIASGYPLPQPGGSVILGLSNTDEKWAVQFASELLSLSFTLYATPSTLAILHAHGISCHDIDPHKEEEIQLIIAFGKKETHLRQLAIKRKVCHATTVNAAKSLLEALKFKEEYSVVPLNQLIQSSKEVTC